MPNAGIHGTRSTNWKSAEFGSNRIHSASVTANEAIESASAAQRITPLRRPSPFGMSSRRMAPASGKAHESVSITLRVGSLSPEVIADDQNHADENRARV